MLWDCCAVLGRVGFSLGALEFLRPSVAPLYAWSSAVGYKGSAAAPWSVKFPMAHLFTELEGDGRIHHVLPVLDDLGVIFLADARAEGMGMPRRSCAEAGPLV